MHKNAVCVGRIVNTHGLKGDLKIDAYTNSLERFEDFDYIYLDEDLKKKYEISQVKFHKNMVLLKFKGMDDINLVEKFKNLSVYIDKEAQGAELEEDEFLISDLVGMNVIDESGNKLGVVKDVLQNKFQDTLVIHTFEKNETKEWFLPFVAEFIIEVDDEKSEIMVELIDGLLE